MRAFVFLGAGRVGVVDRAIPVAGPNDAIIRTTASLICTSDVHTVSGGLPIPEGRILGHESVGVVHAVGSNVVRYKVGDRVAVNAVTPCGSCDGCQRGFTSQCGGMLGGYKFTNQKDGNLAEYFHVNDADFNLALIPAGVTDEQALYTTDMLSTGFIGAEHAQIPLGGSVAIFAQGPVGLSATIGARLCGAGLIIAVEGKADRAALARRYGADIVIDPGVVDPVSEIMSLTGDGVDAAIDALGIRKPSRPASRSPRPAVSFPTSATTATATPPRCRSRSRNSAWAWATSRSGPRCAGAAGCGPRGCCA